MGYFSEVLVGLDGINKTIRPRKVFSKNLLYISAVKPIGRTFVYYSI